MRDGSFDMFRGYVSMTGLAMLNRCFQTGHRLCQMRVPPPKCMLQRGFGMGHKLLGMTFLAVFHCSVACMRASLMFCCS